jgi:hypothetical protein
LTTGTPQATGADDVDGAQLGRQLRAPRQRAHGERKAA